MFSTVSVLSGSSPPARGTQQHQHADAEQRRFIPARAGNTRRRSRTSTAAPVHPRPRGEHSRTPPHTPAAAGSSPPARGTPECPGRDRRGSRFIPARAGNTWRPFKSSPNSTVHPRPRGEHQFTPDRNGDSTVHPRPRGEHGLTVGCGLRRAGSSPPARGTRQPGRQSPRQRRFIPARAGNTIVYLASPSRFSVHPRPRGEH